MLYRTSIKFLTVGAALVIFAAGPATYAENAAPEVEIDWQVLEALDNAMAPQSPAPTLSRPARQTWQPSLTAPPEQPQAVAPPPIPATAPLAPPPVREQQRIVSKPVPLPAMEKHAAPARKAQSFPVKSTVRSESTNPAMAPTKQNPPPVTASVAPPDDGMLPLPVEEQSATADIPLPERKPAAPAQKLKVAVANATDRAVPPLPKPRPNVQKASSSFVAQARTQAALKTAAVEKPPAPAPKIVKTEGPPVAALPPETVKAEALENQIVNPSKQDLVKAIEKIGGNGKLALFRKKAAPAAPEETPVLEKTAARPLPKPAPAKAAEVIDITSEPVETASNDIRDITAVDELTAIEPAASSASAPIPRPPPREKFEEEYITLKYAAGVSDPDKAAQEKLQNDILALLRGNPGWRVQIQAFASPAGEGISNARRISLARALAIRTWLMGQGIEAGRIDVRALGAESDRQPLDRVDLVFFDQKTG